MSNPTFKLRRTKDGQWECWTAAQPCANRCTAVEATPEEAIAKIEWVIADFQAFMAHGRGKCDPAVCSRCNDPGEQCSRGGWTAKRDGKPQEPTETPVTTE